MTRSHTPITAGSDAVVQAELYEFSQEVDRPRPGIVASDPVHGDNVLPPATNVDFAEFGIDAPYFSGNKARRREKEEYMSMLPELVSDAVHSLCDDFVGRRPIYDLYDGEFSLEATETDLEWRLEMPLSEQQIARYTQTANWAVKQCVWEYPLETVPQIVQGMWFRSYLMYYASQQPREAVK